MKDTLDFSDKLAALTSAEMAFARRDPERMGTMIERLAAALGFAVAMAARGNGDAIDELLTGAEGYAHSEAVAKSEIARFFSSHT